MGSSDKFSKEIESRLGKHARIKFDKVQSMKKLMQSRDASEKTARREDNHLPDPNEIPEVRAMIRKQMDEHWKDWIDHKIPALGNVTPRKAAQTPDGRECLIALLRDYELMDESSEPWRSQKKYIDRVRKELGME